MYYRLTGSRYVPIKELTPKTRQALDGKQCHTRGDVSHSKLEETAHVTGKGIPTTTTGDIMS